MTAEKREIMPCAYRNGNIVSALGFTFHVLARLTNGYDPLSVWKSLQQ